MATQIAGNSGVVNEVDLSRNTFWRRAVDPAYSGSFGGQYLVTGYPSTMNISGSAATSGSVFAYIQQPVTASTSIYITKVHLTIASPSTGTVGTAPSNFVWQRFSGTPPVGTSGVSGSRSPVRKDTTTGGTSFLVCADTPTPFTLPPGFTPSNIITWIPISNMPGPLLHFGSFDEEEFIRLGPGEGMYLASLGPTPQILFNYVYAIHYYEK